MNAEQVFMQIKTDILKQNRCSAKMYSFAEFIFQAEKLIILTLDTAFIYLT